VRDIQLLTLALAVIVPLSFFAASTLGLATPDHAREQGAFGKIFNLGEVCLRFLKTFGVSVEGFGSGRMYRWHLSASIYILTDI